MSEFNLEAANQVIQKYSPGDFVTKIVPFGEGMLNKIYLAKLQSQTEPVIIKVRTFEDSEYGQEFAAERLVYPELPEGQPLRPKLLYSDVSDHSQRVAVFEFIAGETFDIHLQLANDDKANMLKTVDSLAKDLATIHGLKKDGYGTLLNMSHGPSQTIEFWHELFLNEICTLKQSFLGPARALTKAVDVWLQIIADSPPELVEPCLVHGDVHGKNLIVNPKGVYFIDWEAARLRSSIYDLVQIFYLNLGGHVHFANHLKFSYLVHRGLDGSYLSSLDKLLQVFTCFWKIRMGMFLINKKMDGNSYFGRTTEYRQFIISERFL